MQGGTALPLPIRPYSERTEAISKYVNLNLLLCSIVKNRVRITSWIFATARLSHLLFVVIKFGRNTSLTFFSSNIDLDAEIVWCQEEPMNMGAFNYIAPRLCTAMKSLQRGSMDDIKYIGRPPSAATATGFHPVHEEEQKQLRQKAIQPEPIEFP